MRKGRLKKSKGKAALPGPHASCCPYSTRVTSFGDPRWHISIWSARSPPARCRRWATHHPAAEASTQRHKQLRKDHLRARPLLGLLVFRGPRGEARWGAHHAGLPAPGAALRAALAPAGGGPWPPGRAPREIRRAAARSARPRQGSGFRSRLQRGGEPQHREHLLLQPHQPSWPGKTLSPSADHPPPQLPRSRSPLDTSGCAGNWPRETSGTRKPFPCLSPVRQSLPCPSLGSCFGHRSASPRAHPGLVAAIPGLCRGAGTRILCGSWLRLGLSPGSRDGYVRGRKEVGGGGQTCS
jgi:hypothetical protein